VSEPWRQSSIGSSTMPHKINPMLVERMVSLARKIRYNASLITEVMVVDTKGISSFCDEMEKLEEILPAHG